MMLQKFSLAALFAGLVASDSETTATAMVGMLGKMMASKMKTTCNDPHCCRQSSCYKVPTTNSTIPMLGCDKRRGNTRCVGGHIKGVCSCTTGSCGINGVCPDSLTVRVPPQASGDAMGVRPSAGSKPIPGWSRLYADPAGGAGESIGVPPEDFTLPFAFILVSLGIPAVSVGLRLRHWLWMPCNVASGREGEPSVSVGGTDSSLEKWLVE